MKITVWAVAKDLVDMAGSKFESLDAAKAGPVANVTIQNTSSVAVYIENWNEATVDGSYVLSPDNQVEFVINNLARLSFITAWTNAAIRIITS